jgi:hypothetical protein
MCSTDIAKMLEDFLKRRDPTGGRVSGAFYELFKRAQKPIKVVERESATLDGVDHLGLAWYVDPECKFLLEMDAVLSG